MDNYYRSLPICPVRPVSSQMERRSSQNGSGQNILMDQSAEIGSRGGEKFNIRARKWKATKVLMQVPKLVTVNIEELGVVT